MIDPLPLLNSASACTDTIKLAQDDEGFEIADFGAEESGDDEEEGRGGDRTQPGQEGPRYDPPSRPVTKSNVTRDIPRESLDGETMFAVGEDGDRWSEDEDDHHHGEGKKLVGKDS
jgi:hypothetical protein